MTANLGIVNGVTRPPLPVTVRGDQPRLEPAPGTWYMPRHVGASGTLSQTSMAVQGFTLNSPGVIDRVRFEVTTAASGTAVAALYGSDQFASPGTLLWSGSADTSTSTGARTITCTIDVPAGTYWIGVMGGTAAAGVRGDSSTTSTPSAASPRRRSGASDNIARNGAYYFNTASGTPPGNPRWLEPDVFIGIVANIELRFA